MDIDITAYLIIGPENTMGRPVESIVEDAIKAGFTCVQIRSKIASVRELINCAARCADKIDELKMSDKVALLINDRLDVALAARMNGVKVDGVHVGQDDIPVEVCRKYLGDNAIVGLSARRNDLFDYVKTNDFSNINYFGIGPLHKTTSKPDAGRLSDGSMITRSFDELSELAKITPVPIVVGGGVTVEDIPSLARTGAGGFFVISSVCSAANPYLAAKELIECWKSNRSK
ncbi:MAG: thiamine phosphate synthase [Selenomonadaceae bacterium]|nr:thiamine phosphate synthase [Selenomonadaceae bacterium]